ncbi:hypothetical protein EDB85DRAFT_1840872, partial [Lactarius pseudohatsudake]
LVQSKLYVGSPALLPLVCWEQGKASNVLSDKMDKTDVVMLIVGRALGNWMNCDPHGNFTWKYGSLETTKFQVQLGKLVGTPFEKDFEKMFEMFTKIQGQAAATQDHRYFLVIEAGNRNLHFAEPVFDKRGTTVDVDAGENVDDTTENWPIAPDFPVDLDRIKTKYAAQPLHVFQNNMFVPPEEVTEVVKGALIEVHFRLFHYFICNQSFDSFNATVEQVIVPQPSAPEPSSPYKR